MIRSLIFGLFSSFSKILPRKEMTGSKLEEEAKAWRIKTSSYRDKWKQEYIEWSKPENIAARLKQYEEEAPKALERGLKMKEQIRKDLNIPLEDPPLPKELSKEMRGQSESTIRAMLRQESMEYNWKLNIWEKK